MRSSPSGSSSVPPGGPSVMLTASWHELSTHNTGPASPVGAGQEAHSLAHMG